MQKISGHNFKDLTNGVYEIDGDVYDTAGGIGSLDFFEVKKVVVATFRAISKSGVTAELSYKTSLKKYNAYRYQAFNRLPDSIKLVGC